MSNEEQNPNIDMMEDENESITMNSIDSEIHTEIDIKEEPVLLEGTTEANPELKEPGLESEVQNEIKVEADDILEIPHRRDRTSRALRLLETNRSIRHVIKKMRLRQKYYNALMEARAKEHEVKIERLRMNSEVLKMQIQYLKKMNEFHQQQFKIRQEILEQCALQLDLLKNKSK